MTFRRSSFERGFAPLCRLRKVGNRQLAVGGSRKKIGHWALGIGNLAVSAAFRHCIRFAVLLTVSRSHGLTVSLSVFIAVLFIGCAPHPSPQKLIDRHLRTDITPFLSQLPPPADPIVRSDRYTRLLQHRYAPWIKRNATDWTGALWSVEYLKNRQWYGINRLPISKGWIEKELAQCNYEKLGTLNRPAITLTRTDLRLLPTRAPLFQKPWLDGEGYPFDYNQNSAVHPFTPLLLSHTTRDGGWSFVKTPFALGWIPSRDIRTLSPETVDTLIAARLISPLIDRHPLYDDAGRFVTYADIGTLIPVTAKRKPLLLCRCRHKPLLGCPPSPPFAAEVLPMTADRVALIVRQLLHQPYGWGGVAGFRDCSATTRDFFMPFGIWLPRNSGAQAKVGRILSLKGMTPAEKEATIIKEGIPFRTLLHLPGHIMLYVGQAKGHAWVLHTMWGIHTKNNGRRIIGQTVISDLYLGADMPDIEKKDRLIEKIDSMNILE